MAKLPPWVSRPETKLRLVPSTPGCRARWANYKSSCTLRRRAPWPNYDLGGRLPKIPADRIVPQAAGL